jgi:hypothetical protein
MKHYYHYQKKKYLLENNKFLLTLLSYSKSIPVIAGIENSKLLKNLQELHNVGTKTVKIDKIQFFTKKYIRIFVDNNFLYYFKVL